MYFRYGKKTAKLGVALKTYKEKKKKGFNYSEEEDTGIMTGLLALGLLTWKSKFSKEKCSN